MGAQIVEFLASRLAQMVRMFQNDSLFRNAVYLMASTAIMSALGFGFWLFIAHIYAAADIGAASALIAITLLISNFSFLGLNSGLVRFLPGSKNQSRDINAALIVVAAAAAVASLIYLASGLGGNLAFFTAHWWSKLLFVALMVTVSLNTLTDSIFIANRRAEFHTIVYAVFGVIKLVAPLFLVPLGSLGVFLAYIAAVVVSLILSIVLMRRVCGYRLLSAPNWGLISATRKYAGNNYVAVLLSGLPSQVMPVLIIGRLGEAPAAYFAMAWTMANLLYVIPSAITNSLLAESSHDLSAKVRHVRHSVRILAAILVPAVLLAVVVAPYLLRLFGEQYSVGGTTVFQLLAVATFFIGGINVGNTIMNIEHRTGGIVMVQAAIALSTLGLVWLLMGLGLGGVGLAMLAGNAVGLVVQWALLAKAPSPATTPDG